MSAGYRYDKIELDVDGRASFVGGRGRFRGDRSVDRGLCQRQLGCPVLQPSVASPAECWPMCIER